MLKTESHNWINIIDWIIEIEITDWGPYWITKTTSVPILVIKIKYQH